jgi:hypothetical protein
MRRGACLGAAEPVSELAPATSGLDQLRLRWHRNSARVCRAASLISPPTLRDNDGMDRRIEGPLLWLRSSLLGLVQVMLGVFAHLTGGGLLPNGAGFVVLLGLALPAASAVMCRPARWLSVVGAVVLGQFLVHAVLSLTAGHIGEPPPAFAVGALAAELAGHAPMTVAHLGGAALVGAWLACGEEAFWTFVVLLTTALAHGPLLPPMTPAARPRRRPVERHVVGWSHDTADRLRRIVVRRGPPFLLVR